MPWGDWSRGSVTEHLSDGTKVKLSTKRSRKGGSWFFSPRPGVALDEARVRVVDDKKP